MELYVGVVWGILEEEWQLTFPHFHWMGANFQRLIVIIGGALIALFGSAVVHVEGSGALAVLIMDFVAGLCWRSQGWKMLTVTVLFILIAAPLGTILIMSTTSMQGQVNLLILPSWVRPWKTTQRNLN